MYNLPLPMLMCYVLKPYLCISGGACKAREGECMAGGVRGREHMHGREHA